MRKRYNKYIVIINYIFKENSMEILSSTKTLSFDDAVNLYNSDNPGDKAIALFFYNGTDLQNGFVNTFPKDWEEFCTKYKNKHNETERFISTESKILKVKAGDEVNPETDKNLVPTEQCADAVLALTQLLQLREFYRQGWKPSPDYKDDYYAVSISVTYENDDSIKYNLEVITCSNDSDDSDNSTDDFPEFYDVFTFEHKTIAEAFIKNHKDLLMEYAKIIL